MKIKQMWELFKKDNSSFRSKVTILAGVTVAVIALFVAAILYSSGQGSRLAITENEIAKEKEFIMQYKKEEQLYEDEFGFFAQPVKKNEVAIIQNDLIQKTKNFGLNVISLNNIASTAPPPVPKTNTSTEQQTKPILESVEFEMGFVGTWEMSVQYLQELQKGSGLLSIRSFSMKPKANAGNLIETNLKYKIYLE